MKKHKKLDSVNEQLELAYSSLSSGSTDQAQRHYLNAIDIVADLDKQYSSLVCKPFNEYANFLSVYGASSQQALDRAKELLINAYAEGHYHRMNPYGDRGIPDEKYWVDFGMSCVGLIRYKLERQDWNNMRSLTEDSIPSLFNAYRYSEGSYIFADFIDIAIWAWVQKASEGPAFVGQNETVLNWIRNLKEISSDEPKLLESITLLSGYLDSKTWR